MEVQKYRPDNINPNEFMRPPTEAVDNRLMGIALRLEGQINSLATQVADKYGIAHDARNKPSLKLGTELELYLFSDRSDPAKDKKSPRHQNPNYATFHQRNILDFLLHISGQNGLASILQDADGVTLDRLMIELRSRPGNVTQYIFQMRKIKDYIKEKSGEYHIAPVAHSQHIHLSLANTQSGNILTNSEVMNGVQKGILDTMRRAYGLLMLPEEVAAPKLYHMGKDNVIPESRWTEDDPNDARLEGRFGTSEYMFDPYLNMVVYLIGIYRGLQSVLNPQNLSAPIVLEELQDIPGYLYISTAPDKIGSYEQVTKQTVQDSVLREFLSPDVLDQLVKPMESYRKVSEGKKRVADVREEMQRSRWGRRVRHVG